MSWKFWYKQDKATYDTNSGIWSAVLYRPDHNSNFLSISVGLLPGTLKLARGAVQQEHIQMNKTKYKTYMERKTDRFTKIQNAKTQRTVFWCCRWRSLDFRVLWFTAHPSVGPCFGQFSVLLTCQDINHITSNEFNLS